MKENIVISIIALSGVLFSALISFFVSKRNASLQVKDFIHKYSQELFIQRMRAYPDLYAILSNLAKKAQKEMLTITLIKETLKKIDDWDSKNILLVGQHVVLLLVQFEKKLEKLATIEPDILNSDPIRNDIVKAVIQIERALKLELGVYSLTEFHNLSMKS